MATLETAPASANTGGVATGVSSLVAMGFEAEAATTAMAGAHGDINRALSSLLGEEQPPAAAEFTRRPSPAARTSRPVFNPRPLDDDTTAAYRFFRPPAREGASSGPDSNPFLQGFTLAPPGAPRSRPRHPAITRRQPADRPAIPSRRARATSAEREREAATQAATQQAEDHARGPSQGTRGSRRRQAAAEAEAEERPARRQRTAIDARSFFPGMHTHTLNFEMNVGGVPATVSTQVLHLPRGPDSRPPSPASIGAALDRASGSAQHRGGASGTDDAAEDGAEDARPDPFRFGPAMRAGGLAAGGPAPGALPFSFVFEIAQEVMRAAGNGQPATRGAKKEVVDALPTVKGGCTDETCPVCQDNFADKDEPTRMPCGHTFHLDCIKPWLAVSTQAICRCL